MSSIGNILFPLSTTIPLGSAEVWQSDGYDLGIWNSLAIMINTDADGILNVSWSGLGSIYDVTTDYTVDAALPFYIVVTPISAWVKLRYTNKLGVQTYFRLYTYGTTTNNATSLVIPPGTQFNINNFPLSAYDELVVVNDDPEVQYTFTNVLPRASQALITNGSTWNTPYYDLIGYAPPDAPNTGALTVQGIQSCIKLQLRLSGTLYQQCYMQGRPVHARPGQGLRCRFGALYVQAPLRAGPGLFSQEWIGMGWASPSDHVLVDGFYFGYLPTGFAIMWVNNEVITTYAQSTWNIDRADGTQVLPNMIWSNLNYFQISTQGNGVGEITFNIENPRTGIVYPVHRIFPVTNSTMTPATNLVDCSLGLSCMGMWTLGSNPTAQFDYWMISDYALFREGPVGRTDTVVADGLHTTITGLNQTLRAYSCGSIFYQDFNRTPIQLVQFNAASGISGIIYQLWVGGYQADASVDGTPVNAKISPLEIYTPGVLSIPTVLVAKFNAYQSDTYVDMTPYNIILSPGMYMVVTASVLNGGSAELSYQVGFRNL